MLSAALTGTVLFSTTILSFCATSAIFRAADSMYLRSGARSCKQKPGFSAKLQHILLHPLYCYLTMHLDIQYTSNLLITNRMYVQLLEANVYYMMLVLILMSDEGTKLHVASLQSGKFTALYRQQNVPNHIGPCRVGNCNIIIASNGECIKVLKHSTT